MNDLDSDVMLDASAAKDQIDWMAAIAAIGDDSGYFQKVGARHSAVFLDNSPTLLVTFDNHTAARQRPKQLPVGMALADECDWSQLCILSDAGPWYRDPAVYAYFDRLVDDGFFEDFDRVLFYGAGPSGYAAGAFSVTSPGARVLLLNPISTLNPGLAGWDTRHRKERKLDFTTRYGFAPDMIESAAAAVVICDPVEGLDAMHSALYHAPHVHRMDARFAGPDIEATFGRMGILNHLICSAMEGKLTPSRFGALWRNRRDDVPYLRLLQGAATPRPAREIMVCRNVAARLKHGKFRKRLDDLLAKG